MAEYTITKVSGQPPRVWSFTDKRTGANVPMETYKVMIEGEDEPIDINRKPGNPPRDGEVLVGTLEDSDFGKKFKSERKPFTPGAGGFRDQPDIKAQWAIRQAVAIELSDKPVDMASVEVNARELFEMTERVKTPPPTQGYEKAKAVATAIKQNIPTPNTFSNGEPVPDSGTDLGEIPF